MCENYNGYDELNIVELHEIARQEGCNIDDLLSDYEEDDNY